jgi:hypothetical protein
LDYFRLENIAVDYTLQNQKPRTPRPVDSTSKRRLHPQQFTLATRHLQQRVINNKKEYTVAAHATIVSFKVDFY